MKIPFSVGVSQKAKRDFRKVYAWVAASVKVATLICHICGVKKTKKKSDDLDDIGQMWVSEALDDTKKMRKAGADIFAKSGPEKTLNKNNDKLRFSPDVS